MRDFDHMIKERLEGYESSLPEGSLEAFHKRRDSMKKTVRPSRRGPVTMAACLLAAAAVALMLVLNLKDVKDTTSLLSEKEQLAFMEEGAVVEPSAPTPDAFAASDQPSVKNVHKKPVLKTEPAMITMELSSETEQSEMTESVTEHPDETDSISTASIKSSQVLEKKKAEVHHDVMPSTQWEEGSGLKKKSHVLPASAGILTAGAAGYLVSIMTGGQDKIYPISPVSDRLMAMTKYNNSAQEIIFVPASIIGSQQQRKPSSGNSSHSYVIAGWSEDTQSQNIPDNPIQEISEFIPYLVTEGSFSHHMPLDIGLSVRFPLQDRLSLTTGIDFSLYTSTLKGISLYSSYNNGRISKLGTQKASYLGFPIRLDYSLARNRWIDVYLGGGTKLDFCVGASINGKKLDRDGLHLSLLGAGGIQLNMTRRLGLYLEPELSWAAVSSNQVLETYRTKHPFMFSLSSGLRLKLP